jgi:hypothetical protein
MQMELIALRHQLAVYKQSVKRPTLRPADRLFWAWLSRWWPSWQEALAFVQPRTVIAWQKKRFQDYWRRLSHKSKPGRPAISKEVRELIQDMWLSNPTWGSPRIVGELHKIGIDVAKSTVEKYRPKVRKSPSPTWKVFLKNHVKDLVSCDFFTVPTVTYKVLFVFVILAHDRRRIVHFNITDTPRLSGRPNGSSRPVPGMRRRGISSEIATPSTARSSNSAWATWVSKKSRSRRVVRGSRRMWSGSSAASDASVSMT